MPCAIHPSIIDSWTRASAAQAPPAIMPRDYDGGMDIEGYSAEANNKRRCNDGDGINMGE